MAPGGESRIALVLPGGGSRGAYQAGALSILLPALEERGERVSVFCGTSVGALNGAALAATAHLPASAQAEALLGHWRAMSGGDVFASVLGPSGVLGLAGAAGQALGVPGLRMRSLLDTRPLHRSIRRWVDFTALAANVTAGHVHATCTVATALADGRPVAFVDSVAGAPAGAAEEIRYVPTRLTAEHVLASAALPILFPAVRVHAPAAAAGDYTDGATRLNAPVKPAIDLGADKVVVIGFEPLRHGRPSQGASRPAFATVIGTALDGLLHDRLDADLHRMAAVNAFFADGADPLRTSAARAYREARGRRPYRRIAYVIVTPRRRHEIARLAEDAYAARGRSLDPRAIAGHALLSRLLGLGTSAGGGELLSLLYFDPPFLEALIELGRRDARRWLRAHPHLWCSDPRHDFDLDPAQAIAERELASLHEWRALRRR
jgi:NTE family protein